MSSFQSQYGLRLSREFNDGMKWGEFKSLLIGISPDTVLGRIVSIRAEKDKDVLKRFSKEQRRIRNEWLQRRAKEVTPQQRDAFLEQFRQAFMSMAGGGRH